MKTIHSIVAHIESHFCKDDLRSVSRDTLENLIISVYDQLQDYLLYHE